MLDVGSKITLTLVLAVGGPLLGAVGWAARHAASEEALHEEVQAWNARHAALQKQVADNQAEISKSLQMLSVQAAVTSARVDLVVNYLGADKAKQHK